MCRTSLLPISTAIVSEAHHGWGIATRFAEIGLVKWIEGSSSVDLGPVVFPLATTSTAGAFLMLVTFFQRLVGFGNRSEKPG